MTIPKTETDEKYRWVSLNSGMEPEYEQFSSGLLNYRPGCVLEILQTDESSRIVYNQERIPVTIRKIGNKVLIPGTIPTARLWIRRSGSMAYKVPLSLKKEGSDQYFLVQEGASRVELFGDQYFSAVYNLINP